MKTETLTIAQTFASPKPDYATALQKKLEHYLKSLLRTTPKPT